MRIIEITGEPILHGGQERFLENLIDSIDIEGLSIDVLTPYYCDNSGFIDLINRKGGNVYELNLEFRPGKSRRLLFDPIKEFLLNNAYDVVHIHSGSISALAYASRAANVVGVKRIIVHSHSTGVPSIKHTLIRFVFGSVLKKNATDFLACSQDAGEMKYSTDIVNRKLIVIKNGIKIEEYRFDERKGKRVRDHLGIKDNSLIFGHVGRFSKEKNHEFLLKVFYRIHAQKHESYLLLIGDGEQKEAIYRKVHQLGLKEYVRFTGNVENVQDYYSAMNVFLLPSVFEGLSYVTLEAQAAGVPCIISDGVPESVVIGDNVFRKNLLDEEGWVKDAISLSEERPVDNSEAIRRAGYDIAVTAEQIKELYLAPAR